MTNRDEGRLDPAVVASLYFEHADELHGFLIGVLRDRELAAEVLQATFVRAIEAGHTAREETLKGWLFRVAFNEAMLLKRKQKVGDKTLRSVAWMKPGQNDKPEDHLCHWEDVERVKQALEKLPPEQRQVVRMRIYEDKTFATIAEELGTPLGTVLTRMRLALSKLQNYLETSN
ncbi:MAG: RNA polymerase sigma factor [Planctomycetes bacterium]|nr:RNA polymerase sigma factor [Planctomycetota bacterium]